MLAPPASAHLLNMTKAEVRVAPSGEIAVHLQIDLTRAAGGSLAYYEISHAPSPDPRLAPMVERLENAVAIQADSKRVPLHVVSVQLPKQSREEFLNPLSWPMTEIELAGALPAGVAVTSLQGVLSAFPFEEPIALTFNATAEERTMTRWLVAGQTSPLFTLQAASITPPAEHDPEHDSEHDIASLARYLVFGFTHILPKGLDHVLFVIGLYLGARKLRTLLILVTSFTLAHSITLGLATIGVIRLPPSVVEPLIAASIAWIAVENFFVGGARYRPLIVFAFGLLHGMGFASALKELQLPKQDFLWSLLSFNVGIELGQLSVVALAMALTWSFRAKPWYRQRIVLPLSCVIATIALAWTIQRVMR